MAAMTNAERQARYRRRRRVIRHMERGPDLFTDEMREYQPELRYGVDRPLGTQAVTPVDPVPAPEVPLWAPVNPVSPDVGLVLGFIESLRVSQGRYAGQGMRVLDWQRKFLPGAFAEGITEAAVSMGRGNGKTAFAAAILCAYLAGPLRQRRGEVLLVASSFGQARIAFEFALEYLRPWFNDKPKDWRIEDSSQRAAVTHRPSGARVRAIASDPKRAHGLAPVLTICDEPAQWPPATSGRMLAALRTAAGKLPGSRLWMIGTRPVDEEHFFEVALQGGPTRFALRYAADPEASFDDEAQWEAANPSMYAMPDLRAAIESEARAAAHDPSIIPSFAALRLNLGVLDEATVLLLEAGQWEAIETEDCAREGDCVWGIDLSGGSAMNGFAAYWLNSGRLECCAYYPASPDLRARGRTDGVDDLYCRMAERGEIGLSGRHAIDLPDVLSQLRERWGSPSAIVADNWRKDALQEALRTAGFSRRTALVFRANGYRDGNVDLLAFRGAAMNDALRPQPSLILRAAMREARVSFNAGGDGKLAKLAEGGRRKRARDDVVAAAILAVAEGRREVERRRGRAQ